MEKNDLNSISPPQEQSHLKDQSDNSSHSEEKQRRVRRSKVEENGRDFACGCGKRYLSYPALYTHVKTKHSGTTPCGTNIPQISTGRSRGRPHKVVINYKYRDQ